MSDCFVNAKDSRCLPRYNHFFAGRATSETLAPRFFAAALGGGVLLREARGANRRWVNVVATSGQLSIQHRERAI